MPLFHQLGRRHSPSRRKAIVFPQDWNALSASMPRLSSHEDSEAGNQDSAHLTFYHHGNESMTTLVPRRPSLNSAPLSQECETFFDSGSESSATLSRHATSQSIPQGEANKPATLWSRRWPLIVDEIPDFNESELGFTEVDTLGPLETLIHELNDIPLSANHSLARLGRFGIRDQHAQWLQRCQTLGEEWVMRRVVRGDGMAVSHRLMREEQSAVFVGFPEDEAEGEDENLVGGRE